MHYFAFFRVWCWLTVYKFLGYTLRLFVWNLYTDAYVSHVHIRITSISFIYGSIYTGKPQLVHNLDFGYFCSKVVIFFTSRQKTLRHKLEFHNRIQFYVHIIKLKLQTAKYHFFADYKFNQIQGSSYFAKHVGNSKLVVE